MNPEKAVDAILEGEVQTETDVVFPLTIARYAYLEKIGSPLLTGKPDIDGTLATAFVMTCPRDQLKKLRKKEDVLEAALEWADSRPFDQLAGIVDAVVEKLQTLGYVAPNAEDETGKKKPLTGF